MKPGHAGAAAAVLAALLAAGCGKSEPPKAQADEAAERAAATERAKQRAYGGTEVKALEDAKKIEADLNEKAKARDPDSK